MRQSIIHKATVELTALIETWFDTLAYPEFLPHLPPDVAAMMAQQAVRVIEILSIGEKSMADEDLLKEDE